VHVQARSLAKGEAGLEAMKLPDNCSFVNTAANEDNLDEINRSECCRRFDRFWTNFSEEPLCRSREKEKEVYRFSWRSSFDGDACVRITRDDKSIRSLWRKFGGSAAIAPLSVIDWNRVKTAITVTGFWSIEPESADIDGFDGAQWLIEGRRGDIYHAVQLWSPGGAIQELGRLLFAIAGPPLAGFNPY
jgi:hypothetical protein